METRHPTTSEILGIALGLVAIALAFLALTPKEWSAHLNEWRAHVGPDVISALIFVSGVLSGFAASIFRRRSSEERGPRVIIAAEYEAEVRRLIESGKYRVLKVFGYTGETVWADLIRFDDRYKEIEVQMIHRNWQVEAKDEREYNRLIKPPRLWAKSAEIRRFGMQSWNHALKRNIRYYSHHPIIKGIILCQPRSEGRVAFLSCYHWVARPAEGGSIFKGANMNMLKLDDEMPRARPFIDYLESQFDYEWGKSQTSEQLHRLEVKAGPTT